MPHTQSTLPLTKQRIAAFIGVSVGNFLVLLDTSILTVALPDIQINFQVGLALLPWASISYTIIFSGFLLAAGAMSDRFGAIKLYRGSLIAFAGLSIALAASPNIVTLIGLRAFLGIAAACIVPSSIALLSRLYPEPGERSKAIGAWAALTSVGLLAGPIIGGILTDISSWRLIFIINPPIAILAMVLVGYMPNILPSNVRPIDKPGILLSIVLLCCLSFGFIDGGINGWNRMGPVYAILAAAISGVLLVVVEARSKNPVLPLGLFARRDVSLAILAAMMATMVFYGILFTLTLWYHRELGYSAMRIGFSFIPMTLPLCVLPIFTGRLVAAFGARRLIICGLLCDVLAGISLIGAGYGLNQQVWIAIAEVALVLASTTVIPAATAYIAVTAPPEYAGSAQGALNAGRQAGSALGVAILGPLTSLGTVGWVLACLCILVLVVAFVSTPSQKRTE